MVETYRSKVRVKDPPVQTYVHAVHIEDFLYPTFKKVTIVPEAAAAVGLLVRNVDDTEDRIRLTEEGKIEFGVDPAKLTELSADIYGRLRIEPYLEFGFTKGGFFSGHIGSIPDSAYDCGQESRRWKDIYLSRAIKSAASATDYFLLQSHNGTAYVDCAKLIGGVIEIAKGKLTGNVELKSFDPGTSVSIAAGATYTVPTGAYYVFLAANTIAEAYDDIAAAWKTIITAGGSGLIISDGTNVRLYNTGAAAESSNMRRVF